ncbi:MAG: hypothetical protein ACOY4H_15180 [Thermodesulfobacteriota bacterium]
MEEEKCDRYTFLPDFLQSSLLAEPKKTAAPLVKNPIASLSSWICAFAGVQHPQKIEDGDEELLAVFSRDPKNTIIARSATLSLFYCLTSTSRRSYDQRERRSDQTGKPARSHHC